MRLPHIGLVAAVRADAGDELSALGEELVVGVNSHVNKAEPDFEGLVLDTDAELRKASELSKMKKNRNQSLVDESLHSIKESCRDGTNLMDPIISAVKVETTVGEINSVLREEFGTWVSPSGV